MKQVKIQSKNGKESINVMIHKNTLITDERGFAPVTEHHMYMDSINANFIKQYYDLPEGISI